MKRVGDVCQLWLQVLVVEEVLGACYIKNIRGKLIQCMLESLLGYFKRSGNELVAVFDGRRMLTRLLPNLKLCCNTP